MKQFFKILLFLSLAVPALPISLSYADKDKYKFNPDDLYSHRPDILTVAKKGRIEKLPSGFNWKNFEESYMYLLAYLTAVYPDSDYYFLARDIEYLYDVARIVYKNDKKMLGRLHVLPVGRNVTEHENLQEYLEQEGLTKKRMGNRAAVFIDSCCEGSVPDALINILPPGVHGEGFLIQADRYPISGMFSSLVGLGSAAVTIERHPHYNEAARDIVKYRGRYEVVMKKAQRRGAALRAMQSLRTYYDNDKMRTTYQDLAADMKAVVSYVLGHNSNLKAAKKGLARLNAAGDFPLDDLFADLGTLERQNWASVTKSRVSELQDSEFENHPFESIEGLLDLEDYERESIERMAAFIKFLEHADTKALAYPDNAGKTEAAHNTYFGKTATRLIERYLQEVRYVDEDMAKRILVLAKTSKAKVDTTKLLMNMDDDSDFVKVAIQSKIIEEKCSLGDGSTLATLLRDSYRQSRNLIFWMEICLSELKKDSIDIILTSLFAYHNSLSNDEALDFLIEAMEYVPTVQSAIVQGILNSFNRRPVEQQAKFLKWLVSQEDYWEAGIENLPLYLHPELTRALKMSETIGHYNMSWLAKRYSNKKTCKRALKSKR